jgi:hypothetical protein
MIWVALLIAVVLVGLTVAGIIGRIDGSLSEPHLHGVLPAVAAGPAHRAGH